MAHKDKKLGRYRKGVKPLRKMDWFPITSKFSGSCVICKKAYEAEERVMFRPNAIPGEKIAHIKCYLNRKENRSRWNTR